MTNKNFKEWWNETGYNALCAANLESIAGHMQFDHTQSVIKIAEMAFNAGIKPVDPHGAFVIVVERDAHANDSSKINGSGPMVMETYPGRASIFDAIERARGFNGRYGWTEICRLDPLGSPDVVEALMDERNKSRS